MNYRKGVKGAESLALQGGVKLKKEDYFPLMSSPGQFLENGGREPTPQYRRRIRDANVGHRVAPIKGRNPLDLGEPSP